MRVSQANATNQQPSDGLHFALGTDTGPLKFTIARLFTRERESQKLEVPFKGFHIFKPSSFLQIIWSERHLELTQLITSAFGDFSRAEGRCCACHEFYAHCGNVESEKLFHTQANFNTNILFGCGNVTSWHTGHDLKQAELGTRTLPGNTLRTSASM